LRKPASIAATRSGLTSTFGCFFDLPFAEAGFVEAAADFFFAAVVFFIMRIRV
jgi:hypothetical protein